MKLKLSILTAFFIGTFLFPQYTIANFADETLEEQATLEVAVDDFEETEVITEAPDEYLEIETETTETQEQNEVASVQSNDLTEQSHGVTVDVAIAQEAIELDEDLDQEDWVLDVEDLTAQDQELISEEHVNEEAATVTVQDQEVDIDDLLASLEEFEATNPIQDLSLSDKIKLAIEFLKIKAEDNKYVITGVSIGTILCLVCIYFAYKYHKNKAPNLVV